MKTTTRRQFLATLGAVAAAPLAVHLAAKQAPTPEPDLKVTTYPMESKVRYAPGLIKVPSNRVWFEDRASIMRDGYHPGRNAYWVYHGEWNGTFKLERGCTNPAYILASLTPAGRDWVLCDNQGDLNWTMLYHYGQWCDEIAEDWTVMSDAPHGLHTEISSSVSSRPRFTCSAVCRTAEETAQLRETLRMHCLRWQSTDPRYRTSYPGIPFPENLE